VGDVVVVLLLSGAEEQGTSTEADEEALLLGVQVRARGCFDR
jgi:hypothetical protein